MFNNYEELPQFLIEHVLTVSKEKDIKNISLQDINGWYELMEENKWAIQDNTIIILLKNMKM